jgi:hypothetical protein
LLLGVLLLRGCGVAFQFCSVSSVRHTGLNPVSSQNYKIIVPAGQVRNDGRHTRLVSRSRHNKHRTSYNRFCDSRAE